MTWDQLIGKIREGLGESGAHIQVAGNFLAKVGEVDGVLNEEKVVAVFTLLTLAVSDLHSVAEHLSIGLDALAELMRPADKSQEVKDA